MNINFILGIAHDHPRAPTGFDHQILERMMAADYCTCGPRPRGPPWDDGSDDGPCDFCEEQAWRADQGQRDEDFEVMLDGRTELTAEERFAALASMGEPDDSLMLGGCGGGERDPDLEWW